jgi:hypothetical protein
MVQAHQDSREKGTTKPIGFRRLIRFGMGPQILKRFYSCTITAWYGNCSASDRKALQRVVRTAQYITGAKLPAIQDLYTRRCQRKALKIVKDSSHPSHLSATIRQAVPDFGTAFHCKIVHVVFGACDNNFYKFDIELICTQKNHTMMERHVCCPC